MPRGVMSPEKRQMVLALAWAARAKKREERKNGSQEAKPGLRTERSFYEDDREVWINAARVEGVRLPVDWKEPLSTTAMHKFLTKCGIPKAQYNAWWGMNVRQTIEANPDWPLRAWAGIVVEHMQQILEYAE